MGAIGAVGGALGGIAGARRGPGLGAPSELESQGFALQRESLSALQRFAGAGPGEADVRAGTEAQRQFAEQLGRGPIIDISRGQRIAAQLFRPQQVALEQSFRGAEEQTRQLAARLGRSADDPILRARLARGLGEQTAQLQARQGAEAQRLALQLGAQQTAFQRERTGVLAGLGEQAFDIRRSLFGLGGQAVAQERQQRLAQQRIEAGRGGGFRGFLSGALAGAGAGLGAAGQIQALSGGLGAGGAGGTPPFAGGADPILGGLAGTESQIAGGGGGFAFRPLSVPRVAPPPTAPPQTRNAFSFAGQSFGGL